MADKASIAIRKHYAIERIQDALNRLLEQADTFAEPVDIPRTHRYPEALANEQLEVIAEKLELLSPAPEVETMDFTQDEHGFKAMTLPDEDMPDGDVEVTEFDIDGDGVIVAETEDGDEIVSDGQEEPEPRKGKGKR